jgi:opacity protein-like surface antigen
MHTFRPLVVLVAMLALILAAASSAAAAPNPQQWTVNNNVGPVKGNVEYELVNQTNHSRIGYDSRTGVDLGWTSQGGNFELRRANERDHRAARPGETFALYNTKTRRYVVYGKQTFGINLDFTSSPVYEWKVSQARGAFSLYNTRARDYVVYGKRTWGINLVWAGLTGEGDGLTKKTVELPRANLIWTGFRNFRGPTGVSQGDHLFDTLVSIQNASADTLYFQAGDEDGTSWGRPDAVTLAPRATMTAAQMKVVFGKEAPKMQVFLDAYIKEPTPVTVTHLNITYIDR